MGSSVSVRVDGLSDVRGRLLAACDEFDKATACYAVDQRVARSAFGETDVADAWAAFDAVWEAELATIKQALPGLVDKLSATASTYTQAGDADTRSAGSIPP